MEQNVACGTPNMEPEPRPEGYLRLASNSVSISIELFSNLSKVEADLDNVVRTARATLETLRQNQAGNER